MMIFISGCGCDDEEEEPDKPDEEIIMDEEIYKALDDSIISYVGGNDSKACSEQGTTCSPNEFCPKGQWLESDDQDRCCQERIFTGEFTMPGIDGGIVNIEKRVGPQYFAWWGPKDQASNTIDKAVGFPAVGLPYSSEVSCSLANLCEFVARDESGSDMKFYIQELIEEDGQLIANPVAADQTITTSSHWEWKNAAGDWEPVVSGDAENLVQTLAEEKGAEVIGTGGEVTTEFRFTFNLVGASSEIGGNFVTDGMALNIDYDGYGTPQDLDAGEHVITISGNDMVNILGYKKFLHK